MRCGAAVQKWQHDVKSGRNFSKYRFSSRHSALLEFKLPRPQVPLPTSLFRLITISSTKACYLFTKSIARTNLEMNISYSIEKNQKTKSFGIICMQFVQEGDVVYSLAQDSKKVVVDDRNLEEYLSTVHDVLHVLNYGFCSGNTFVDLQLSDDKYIHHSMTPNVKYLLDREVSVALRDIHPGEEITENYWEYTLPPNYDRLMHTYVQGNYREQSVNWN
jgi:hypothetical protein